MARKNKIVCCWMVLKLAEWFYYLLLVLPLRRDRWERGNSGWGQHHDAKGSGRWDLKCSMQKDCHGNDQANFAQLHRIGQCLAHLLNLQQEWGNEGRALNLHVHPILRSQQRFHNHRKRHEQCYRYLNFRFFLKSITLKTCALAELACAWEAGEACAKETWAWEACA